MQHVLASESTATVEAYAIAKDVNFDLVLLDVGWFQTGKPVVYIRTELFGPPVHPRH